MIVYLPALLILLTYAYIGVTVAGIAIRKKVIVPQRVVNEYSYETVDSDKFWADAQGFLAVVFWPVFLILWALKFIFVTLSLISVFTAIGKLLVKVLFFISLPFSGLYYTYQLAAKGTPWQSWKTYVMRKSS